MSRPPTSDLLDPDADAPVDVPVDAVSAAHTIALRLLERQPRTRAELATALARRGVPEPAAGAVLDRLTDVGLIDDAAFAAAWVDSRHRSRGLARRALRDELRRRGVDPEIVAEAVDRVSGADEAAAARTLVQRRLRSMTRLPVDAQRRRLVAMLGRKGFTGSLAQRVVSDALRADGPARDERRSMSP